MSNRRSLFGRDGAAAAIAPIGLAILTLVGGSRAPHAGQPPSSPANRIAVRTSGSGTEFYDTVTGTRFNPRGFNYFKRAEFSPPILLYPELDFTAVFGLLAGVTFQPGFYDAPAVEDALAQMGDAGYNTVRIFLPGYAHTDLTVLPGERLDLNYVSNVTDLLSRARTHDLHVVLAFGWIPSTYYDIVEAVCEAVPMDPEYETKTIQISGLPFEICAQKGVEGFNALFTHRGIVEAAGAFLVDVLAAIESFDSTILTSLLSIEIQNEPFFATLQEPFSLTSGEVTVTLFEQKSYGMELSGPANQRQELADDAARYWLERVVETVKASYPALLVAAPVFTPYGTGRSGYNGVLATENPFDPRQPFRVSVIAESSVDYVDVHTFPAPIWTPAYDLTDDLTSAELDVLDLGKPLIMGETVLQRNSHPDLGDAIDFMIAHQAASCAYGFTGWLLFPWDVDSEWWTAVEGGGAIRDAFSPLTYPFPCPSPNLSVSGLTWLGYQ